MASPHRGTDLAPPFFPLHRLPKELLFTAALSASGELWPDGVTHLFLLSWWWWYRGFLHAAL